MFVRAVEDGGGHPGIGLDAAETDLAQAIRPGLLDPRDVPAGLGDPPEVVLQDLPDVHAGRDTEGVEDDVDGGAVGEEGHVLHGEDLRDDTLVPVAAGEFVAVADLAFLGDVDPHQLVDPGRKLVVVAGVEDPHPDDGAGLAVRHLEGGVADLAGLLPEDRAKQALLGGQLGLALRGDLADEDVAGRDLGSDADDAALVEVGQHLVGYVGDVAGDLLGAQLRVASVDLVLLDVDRGQDVVLHETLRQNDGVLVVEALPRHERHEEVLAERQLTLVGAGAVGQRGADLDAVPGRDQRALVDAGTRVGAHELLEPVRGVGGVVVGDLDDVGRDRGDHTGLLREGHVTDIHGGAVLHAGADERGLVADQRNRLALHVRSHQRPGCVVVLEERDQRGGHRDHLPG